MEKENVQYISAEAGGISGETLPEKHIMTLIRLSRQERLDKIRQERNDIEDLNDLAEFETKQTELFFRKCKNILKDNLTAGVNYNWASLYNDKPFPPFVYKEPAPKYIKVAKEAGVPQKKLISELLFPSVKNARLHKENDAKSAYNKKMAQYDTEKEAARAAHEKERDDYISGQAAYNSKVEELQFNFEKGKPEAVQSFARIVLHEIDMPDSINVYYDAIYIPGEKQLVIDCLLPAYYDLPRAVGYKYDKGDGVIVTTEMEEQALDAFYLDLIQQITLTVINTVFNAMPARHVQRVGFNGWVENNKIGDTLETKACVITCGTARDVFAALDLLKSPAADCIQEIKGLTAKSLAGNGSVQPIIIVETLPDYDESEQEPDITGGGTKPPEYKPGEFKKVTTKLVGEMLEQIEKNLLDNAGDKDKTIH